MTDHTRLSLVATSRSGHAASMPQLVSLSQGSLIVRSNELLDPGQRVPVTIHLVDSGQEISIDGEVVWANHELGDMALRFLSISEGGREAIAGYLVEWSEQR